MNAFEENAHALDVVGVRRTLLFNELIRFVQLGDYGLFLPRAATQSRKFLKWRPFEAIDPITFIKRRNNNRLSAAWAPQKSPEGFRPDCRGYLGRVFDILGDANMSFGCLDVGGYLGLYSVFFGMLARQRGLKTQIRCFEPGPTQELILANAEINGIDDLFELRRAAVSDVTGPVLYEYKSGMTLSGGIRTRDNDFARLARSTTLDQEIDNGFSELDCIVMKLDVEGFEPDALRGLNRNKDKVAVVICEIQPWAKHKMIGERMFKDVLADDYYLVDIRNSMWPGHYMPVENDKLDAYFDEVAEREEGMSDLVLISKTFPLAKEFFAAFCAMDAAD